MRRLMRRVARFWRDCWLAQVVAQLFAWHVIDEALSPDDEH